MTASVGFRAPRADELAQALLARLADAADAEQSRYRDARQPATVTAGAVPEALQRFARAASPGPWRTRHRWRALGEWLTEPKPQVWFEPVARATMPAAACCSTAARAWPTTAHVFINGESLRAGGRDARLLRTLGDQCRLDARAVSAASRDARALLDEWLRNGWLHPATGETRAPDCPRHGPHRRSQPVHGGRAAGVVAGRT